MWCSLFLLPYTPVKLGTQTFFLSSPLYAVPPSHKEWTVPAGSCPLGLSCLPGSDECYFSGTPPCPKVFLRRIAHKIVHDYLGHNWSENTCKSLWYERNELPSEPLIMGMPIFSSCTWSFLLVSVLLQAMLSLQALWYSQLHIYKPGLS